MGGESQESSGLVIPISFLSWSGLPGPALQEEGPRRRTSSRRISEACCAPSGLRCWRGSRGYGHEETVKAQLLESFPESPPPLSLGGLLSLPWISFGHEPRVKFCPISCLRNVALIMFGAAWNIYQKNCLHANEQKRTKEKTIFLLCC